MPNRYLIPFLKHRFLDPLKELMEDSRAIGVSLLIATTASLVLANSPWAANWIDFWHTETAQLGALHLPHTLEHWINDGLMAIFFLMAGMEIKSELNGGELSKPGQALLPMVAALGGMLVPAAIYAAFNHQSLETAVGWGVPMATDIAFALGVCSLLGKRIPYSLKVFLVALATIDDLGAIVVIAAFYGGAVQWWMLAGALAVLGLIYLFVRRRKRPHWFLLPAATLLWYFVFQSGVHATVAGVALGLVLPVRWLHRLSILLHNWVYFLIVPLFALANTAIPLSLSGMSQLNPALGWGIGLGLLVGKPVGIVLACWLGAKWLGAKLPAGVSWGQIVGAGLLAGIGFTMSIFIATLAFEDLVLRQQAKLLVLLASAAAMLLASGYFLVVQREDPR